MRDARVSRAVILLYILFLSCTQKPNRLSDQLRNNILSRINKIDSGILLDSFTILRAQPIHEKLEKTIQDTLYKQTFSRVQKRLENAIKNDKKDSIEFYQTEINYMLPQIDSLTQSLSEADTTRKHGWLAICRIQLGKNNKSSSGLLFYALDQKMIIRNSDFIDSSISQLVHALH